jgi:Ca-activated chloride channel family protein
MDSPILTDISIKSEGVTLEEIFPSTVSDLWSHKPLIFKARYSKPGSGTIKIVGLQAGQAYEQELKVNLPEAESANNSVSTLWARSKVDELVDQDLMGIQRGNPDQQVKEEIVKLALGHSIMTQFTSFVAVEVTIVTMDGKPVKVTIPVELAEGVSREGVFGPSSTHLLRKSRPAGGVPTATSRGVPGYSGGSTGFGTAASPAPATGHRRQMASVKEERQVQDSGVSKFSKELKELLAMQDTPLNYTKGKVVVKDGQLTVQVWLNRSTDEIIKNLEEKGFKIKFRASTGKMIVGVISLKQLADLEKIPDVIFVEPFSTEG